MSLVNLDPHRPALVQASGFSGNISGRVLSAATMNAHNSFEEPRRVEPKAFAAFTQKGDIASLTLPAKSLVVLAIE